MRAWTVRALVTAWSLALAGCSLLLDTGDVAGGKERAVDAPVEDGSAGAGDTSVVTDASTPDDVTAPDALPTYDDVVRADAPVALFHLDEPAGANSVKDAINGLSAAAVGAITFGVPGVFKTAARFTGQERLELGNVLDFAGTYAFSLELWADPGVSESDMQPIVKIGGAPQTGYALVFSALAGDAGRSRASFYISGPGATSAWSDEAMPPGLVHVVVTATNAGGKGSAVLYVNGIRSPKGSFGNEASSQEPAPWPLYFARFFSGTLDEIAIYDKVLPPDRILAHYQAGKPN